MTLQVIKAEDVRDGEPRIWLAHRQDMPHATTRTMHTSSRRDVGCQSCEFAIVDRPAPFTAAQPPPVLDLDALAEDVAHLAKLDLVGELRGLVSAAPHLIAEARAAVALRQELAALRAHFDAAAPEHNLPALLDLYNDRTTEARAKLAEAKRLGLEAVRLSRDAIEAARMAPVDEPAATVIAIGCLNAADRIAAELEKL